MDLLEVYCSSDSQLTHQCIRQGLKAMRFGLREGNLEYYEGRCKLYEIIFRYRPRHLWFSPSARPGVGGINSIRQGQSNLLERSWKLKVKISFTCCCVKPPSCFRAFEAMPSTSIWNSLQDPTCFFRTQYRP